MKNEDIVKTLKKFELPVYKDLVYEDQIQDYNYFYYTESKIRKLGCKYYQDVTIVWVSENYSNDNFMEIKIIDEIEKLGLKMNGDGEYNHFQKSNTNQYVDTLELTFTRPIRI